MLIGHPLPAPPPPPLPPLPPLPSAPLRPHIKPRRPANNMSLAPPPPASMEASQLAWLARFTHDAQNVSTPIGAFLAGLPQAPKRRAKTSSERGKAFRERQRLYEEELEKKVQVLKKEVVVLDMRRKAWETRYLNTRGSLTGSLARAIQEYHRLFARGLAERPPEPRAGQKRLMGDEEMVQRIQLQEEFIRRMIDPEARVGNMKGPEASIVQWQRYTKSHATMRAEVTAVEVTGSEEEDDESITVVAHCLLHVRLSRDTFRVMFPHVTDEDFLQRMIGKEITYSSVKHFQFSRAGKIAVESVNVDFVGGLLRAGCTLADIATLMGAAAINNESMIAGDSDDDEMFERNIEIDDAKERQVEEAEYEAAAQESEAECSPPAQATSTSQQSSQTINPLSMEFILSEDAFAA